jgi:hypothetical protein
MISRARVRAHARKPMGRRGAVGGNSLLVSRVRARARRPMARRVELLAGIERGNGACPQTHSTDDRSDPMGRLWSSLYSLGGPRLYQFSAAASP